MRALAGSRGFIDPDRLRQGFQHLVVNETVLEQLGPAINGAKAVFLYGKPGNGKTVIAEGMGRALGGDMYMPYAIEVDGNIITMFDPVNHEAIEIDDDTDSVVTSRGRDRRWVRIRRPVVTVGGELTLDMMELTFNPLTKFYEAPLQLKANGGVFVVDDFGRQRIRPQDLLNRWIVPLESRVDYLTLHTARNSGAVRGADRVRDQPRSRSLADEAFLRRIPYKIPIEDPSIEEYIKIFELNCIRRKLHFHPVLVAYLHRRHYKPGRPPDALLSSARPARSGDGALPLPRYAADHHARAARPRLRLVFRRRRTGWNGGRKCFLVLLTPRRAISMPCRSPRPRTRFATSWAARLSPGCSR
jgi:hypothetical protein